MEPFDPNKCNILQYLDIFDHFVNHYSIVEEGKVRVLLSNIGGEAYRVLRTLADPEPLLNLPYLQIASFLRFYYSPEATQARAKFANRNQKEGESIHKYIQELESLVQHCGYKSLLCPNRDGMAQLELKQRFIMGVRDPKIRNRLLSERDLSYRKACVLALTMEPSNSPGPK